MLQCNFCSAAFRKLQRNFLFRLWHVAGVGFRAWMARFARIDSQIRANCLILANRFGVPELEPFFCESRFGGLNIANRRFEAIFARIARTL